MARPTKLTAAVQERIVLAIRAGSYRTVAAQAAGIHPDTLANWLKAGERATRGPYHAFQQAVLRAEAEAELHHAALIAQAAKRSWTAAAWWLERRYPGRWGLKPAPLEDDGPDKLAELVAAMNGAAEAALREVEG